MATRQEEVRELLDGSGTRNTETPKANKKTVEIHLHINGPIVVGSEVAAILLPMLLQVASPIKHKTDK